MAVDPDDEARKWKFRVLGARRNRVRAREDLVKARKLAKVADQSYTKMLHEAIAWLDAHTDLTTREIAALLQMSPSLVSNVRTGQR